MDRFSFGRFASAGVLRGLRWGLLRAFLTQPVVRRYLEEVGEDGAVRAVVAQPRKGVNWQRLAWALGTATDSYPLGLASALDAVATLTRELCWQRRCVAGEESQGGCICCANRALRAWLHNREGARRLLRRAVLLRGFGLRRFGWRPSWRLGRGVRTERTWVSRNDDGGLRIRLPSAVGSGWVLARSWADQGERRGASDAIGRPVVRGRPGGAASGAVEPCEGPFTLEPLAGSREDALSVAGIEGLEEVILVELWHGCAPGVIQALRASDLMAYLRHKDLWGVVSEAVRAEFELVFTDDELPRRLFIRTPDIARLSTPNHLREVRAWLLARGFAARAGGR